MEMTMADPAGPDPTQDVADRGFQIVVIDSETDDVLAQWTSSHTGFLVGDRILVEPARQVVIVKRVWTWGEPAHLELHTESD
jgi:hypothetical protein